MAYKLNTEYDFTAHCVLKRGLDIERLMMNLKNSTENSTEKRRVLSATCTSRFFAYACNVKSVRAYVMQQQQVPFQKMLNALCLLTSISICQSVERAFIYAKL